MTRLAYTDVGTGPPIVLIHGFLLNRTMWQPQLEELPRAGYRAIALDLPGFGESPLSDGETTMSTYSTAVLGLLDTLEVDQPTLVGYSMGGQVAMDLIRQRPQQVGRLVLVGTTSRPDPPAAAAARLTLAARIEVEGTARYALEFLPELVNLKKCGGHVADHAMRMMRQADPAGAAAALRARVRRPDYGSVLVRFKEPALVVAGDHDVFDRGELAAEMSRTLPYATLRSIPGAGHTPSLEAPEEFDAVLLDFLER